MRISTHVLDAGTGAAPSGLMVTLYRREPSGWQPITQARTDASGRISDLAPGTALPPATYRLVFEVGALFAEGLYPEVTITVRLADATRDFHLPLVLSPFGYSTYLGSSA